MHPTIESLVQQFQTIEHDVAKFVTETPYDTLYHKDGEAWSAADYFKHMILALKPFVKATEMPKDALIRAFGESNRESRDADTIVTLYKQRIAEGVRAEMAPTILPVSYRLPEGLTDEKAYLVEQWHDAHKRLYAVLEKTEASDYDHLQMPHPAINLLTLREMLYFTTYHNTLHFNDMKALV
jgi:hypothetical protein